MFHPSGGPRLPRSVGGLLEAMRAAVSGDSRPLEDWDRHRRPALMKALEAWTEDALLSDRLVSHIVEATWTAVETGRDVEIRSEIAWMAGVARRSRASFQRDQRPIREPLPTSVRAPAISPLAELIHREDRDRIRRVIAILPERHRLAITLRHVNDLSEADVAEIVGRIFKVGFDATRKLLREGRQMVRVGLEGLDPRGVYPRRYARDKKRESERQTVPLDSLFGNYMVEGQGAGLHWQPEPRTLVDRAVAPNATGEGTI